MPHIHNEPGQHDTTVSAYIVRIDSSGPVILLHRHKRLNKYLQFGGHVELMENPWKALAHELVEESGYNMDQLKVLQPSEKVVSVTDAVTHPLPVALITHKFGDLDHYHTDVVYAFVTDEMPVAVIGEDESKDVKTFTSNELAALPDDEIPENVREIGLFVLDECFRNWIRVEASKV